MFGKWFSAFLSRRADKASLEDLMLTGLIYKISASDEDSISTLYHLNNFVDSHIVPSWNNNYRIKSNPTNKQDILISGDGKHLIKVGETYALVVIDKAAKGIMDTRAGKTINIYGPKKHLTIMRDALGSLYSEGFDLPKIFRVTNNGWREQVGYVPTIYKEQEQYIKPAVYDEVCFVIERMLKGREWYNERLLPYKETIMLEGPPRTGKSNLSRHVSSVYGLNIVLANPATILELNNLKELTIALIEEIDAYAYLCADVEEIDTPQTNGIENAITPSAKKAPQATAYSDFINHLCGVVPLDNLIVIITTNNMHKLRKSVIGKGRINRRIHVPHLTQDEVIHFLGSDSKYDYIRNIKDYVPGTINAANMSELRHAKSAEEVEQIVLRN